MGRLPPVQIGGQSLPGARSRGSRAGIAGRHPDGEGAEGAVGGRDPEIFVRHAYGMTGGARARAGRHVRVGVRVGVGQAGTCACAWARRGRAWGAWAWGRGRYLRHDGPARARVRARVRARGRVPRPPSPDLRVLLARCLKTRGVTSKIVGRQRSRGRFRYISVGHSAHERKVGPCVAVLRGPSVDR